MSSGGNRYGDDPWRGRLNPCPAVATICTTTIYIPSVRTREEQDGAEHKSGIKMVISCQLYHESALAFRSMCHLD